MKETGNKSVSDLAKGSNYKIIRQYKLITMLGGRLNLE